MDPRDIKFKTNYCPRTLWEPTITKGNTITDRENPGPGEYEPGNTPEIINTKGYNIF